ncbi:MAG: hypothetical protein IJI57_04815 [Flexilinea sp.]|nr:hypothetical protein [Flexilinea sp.]
MSKWIELHDAADGGEILINRDTIEGVFTTMPVPGSLATQIDVVDGTQYTVREDYEFVKELLCQEN